MKKKNLWHLLAIMMVAVLSIGFAACGDDDEDEDNGGPGNVPSKVSNSLLSSRLKDKDGNPVFLTYNGRGYRYASDGKLAVFGNLEVTGGEEHCVVDGLTFRAEENSSKGSKWWNDGSLELNKDGLITKAVLAATGTRANGQLKNKVVITLTFSYNSDRQLQKIDEDTKGEKYDENGNLEEVLTGHGIQTRTWENGNMTKVEYTGDPETLLSNEEPATYGYGNEENITRQPLSPQTHLFSDFGINHLYALGLLGVGPKNFPSDMTATLNENGTIHTLKKRNWLDSVLYEYLER